MDYKRLTLAAVVAWAIDGVYGVVVWMQMMSAEMARFPAIFRPQAEVDANLPLMFVGGLVGMFALAYVYARGYEGRGGVVAGLRFGLVMAIFVTGFVSISLYGSLRIDPRAGVMSAGASFVEMLLIGAVFGALYRPAPQPSSGPMTV